MKVILKDDVKDLGVMGDVVDVKTGYGRNFLIPRGAAVEANPKNIKQLEHEKNIILQKAKKMKKSAQDRAEDLSKMVLSFEMQAGEEEKLFGSVTVKDIAEAIESKGIEIDKKKIILDEPIKKLGSYDVPLKIYQDVTATIKVEVIKTEAREED